MSDDNEEFVYRFDTMTANLYLGRPTLARHWCPTSFRKCGHGGYGGHFIDNSIKTNTDGEQNESM